MTDKPTPTDAELNTILCAHWPAFAMQSTLVKIRVRDALQDAIDKWGQPAQARAGAVTDAQVLAAVRVVSPGLFRHGLQPLPNDGANTAAQMRKEADTVRKMLEAAHGIKGG